MTTEKPKEKITKEQAEKLILEMGKKGMTAEKIGLELKKENFNARKEGIKISKVLKKHNLYKDPNFESLKVTLERLRKHSEKNGNDKIMKRSLIQAEALLMKIIRKK